MISLYLDTSSNYLYAGVVKDGLLLADRKKEFGQSLSKETLPEVISMLEEAKISPQDVDKLFVVTGPGSFTGIRIGVTIAKTYAWALQKEIIPVSGLCAMALSSCSKKEFIMPLIDARRGYVFGSVYDREGKSIISDQHILLSTLEEMASKYDYEVITNSKIKTKEKQISYSPDIVKIVKYYEHMEAISPHLINPNYLKKTEAEEKKGL